MKKLLRILGSIAVIGYIIYARIPQYHEFDAGVYELASNEYEIYSFSSDSSAPLRVELAESSGKSFDAYLLSFDEFEKISTWMDSTETTAPKIDALAIWENVSSVDQDSIIVGHGDFVVMVDNTSYGSNAKDDQAIAVDFVFSEKY